MTFIFLWRCGPMRAMASSFLRLLDHTQRRTTVGRTPLDEWSARRRDLYLKTHNIHNRQTSMHPVGLEPTISARERPQTYALDRAATGTGRIKWLHKFIVPCILSRKNEIKTTLYLVLFALFRPKLNFVKCSKRSVLETSGSGRLNDVITLFGKYLLTILPCCFLTWLITLLFIDLFSKRLWIYII